MEIRFFLCFCYTFSQEERFTSDVSCNCIWFYCFTRTPGIRQYQPEVFWSWKEILGIGTCGRLGSTTGDGLLQENLLNILLLFPAGILLPGLTGRKLKWWMGLLVGIAVSSAIEISQLLLCRGLFEFDDIIHNSLGCMLGSLLGNRMLRLVHGK
ncbi:MAG: VanZ family protein [Blautia wexlerae]